MGLDWNFLRLLLQYLLAETSVSTVVLFCGCILLLYYSIMSTARTAVFWARVIIVTVVTMVVWPSLSIIEQREHSQACFDPPCLLPPRLWPALILHRRPVIRLSLLFSSSHLECFPCFFSIAGRRSRFSLCAMPSSVASLHGT